MPNTTDDPLVQEKLVELEARIIEQDYRLFPVVWNFLSRKRWHIDDPRRSSAGKAIIRRILFSPTVVATGGSLVGAATIGLLIWQNIMIRTQTELAREQLNVLLRDEPEGLVVVRNVLIAPIEGFEPTSKTSDAESSLSDIPTRMIVDITCFNPGKKPWTIDRAYARIKGHSNSFSGYPDIIVGPDEVKSYQVTLQVLYPGTITRKAPDGTTIEDTIEVKETRTTISGGAAEADESKEEWGRLSLGGRTFRGVEIYFGFEDPTGNGNFAGLAGHLIVSPEIPSK